MSFKVTCLCVITTQDIWGMTPQSVKISIFAASRRIVAHVTADSMGLSSLKFFVLGSKRCIFSAIKWYIDHSRSSKVDDFGTSRKRVLYFLLVRHSNQGPIVSDMLQLFGWKLQFFPILLLVLCGAPLQMFYLELRGEVYHEETN